MCSQNRKNFSLEVTTLCKPHFAAIRKCYPTAKNIGFLDQVGARGRKEKKIPPILETKFIFWEKLLTIKLFRPIIFPLKRVFSVNYRTENHFYGAELFSRKI